MKATFKGNDHELKVIDCFKKIFKTNMVNFKYKKIETQKT